VITLKAIQHSLKFLVQGRTTLSIAHRLSTLRDADRLIVIDGGRIVEEGTWDSLLVSLISINITIIFILN
jgi:ATP-binding cassette subfamily B protein